MKVVQINTFSYKAAGNIMMNLHKALLEEGIDSYVAWGRGRKAENEHEYYMNDDFGVTMHGLYTRLTDKHGFGSANATNRLIKWIDNIEPDVIHLHCIHGYYINIELLIKYIKQKKIKVIWTQHDCWAFTGHCAYFDAVECDKWKNGCHDCEQLSTYPASVVVDNSIWNWEKKKCLYNGLNPVLVSPSFWLRDILKNSFLGSNYIEVINNGIDLSVFHQYKNEDILTKYSLDNRPIVLSVASEWTERKGLKDIIELSNRIKSYQFVVVGLTEEQIRKTPKSIMKIKRTENTVELAKLYSAAKLFFNPTYEDVFGMVNIESLACGTPVLTYDSGGSPETIGNGQILYTGNIYHKKSKNEVDYDALQALLLKSMAIKNRDVSKKCIDFVQKYSVKNINKKYINLYYKVTE